jgi:signal transduction histidine kinase
MCRRHSVGIYFAKKNSPLAHRSEAVFQLWPKAATAEAVESAARPARSSRVGELVGKPFRYLVVFTLVVLVVGGWVSLYLKARALDLQAASGVLGMLRELKGIDQRWNDRLIGARLSADGQDASALAASQGSASVTAVARLQSQLAQRSFQLGGLLSAQSLSALRDAFEEKARAMDGFLVANRAYRASLERLVQRGDAVARAARARAGARDALPAAVERDAERATSATLAYAAQPGPTTSANAQAAIARLASIDISDPERGLLEELAVAARQVVTERRAEDDLFRAALLASTGPRLDTLTKAFEHEFGGAVDESERYRLYLLVYSGLLLILAAYLGWRLAHSYAVINRINLQLREANETLEHRVAERTRELSDALRQLQEQEMLLIQSEKMSSLGQMVAGVAHEVNTPLAYVKSSLDTVSNRMPEISELAAATDRLLELLQSSSTSEADLAAQFQRVSGMMEEAKRRGMLNELDTLVKDGLHGIGQISELVTNLKDFARLDRSKVAQFDLNEGVQSALKIAGNQLKTKTVRTMFATIPAISCSPSQINQVFLNLVTNAAQATPDAGGTITVRTALHGKDHVMVEVSDNGHGIPEDLLPKIFDPFFTTKQVGKGTGLGLSIVYKIVESHGGRIEVDSKQGVGTRFRVILPAKATAQAAAA